MKRCTVSIFIIHVLYMNLAKKWCLSPNKHRFIDIRLFLLAWLLLIGWRRHVPYHKQTHILTTRLDEVSLSLSRFNSDKSSFTIRTISWHISKITRFHIEPFSRFIRVQWLLCAIRKFDVYFFISKWFFVRLFVWNLAKI